jgi:hypothetical protein
MVPYFQVFGKGMGPSLLSPFMVNTGHLSLIVPHKIFLFKVNVCKELSVVAAR